MQLEALPDKAVQKSNLWERVEPLLPLVERPSRYIGGEWVAGLGDAKADVDSNIADATDSADGADLSFCMIYPDTYELGQPNQALRILVNSINKEDGLHAVRSFLPAVDMIGMMRERDIPLFSIESFQAVRDFDVVE